MSTALGFIPEVGELLSALVDIFWPDPQTDVWAEIQAKVEALINQKLAERVKQQVGEALSGLHNVLDDYVYAAKNFPDSPKYISEKFNVAQGLFLHDRPQFQSEGYELLLLPLFAQFGSMHLGLLRDGVAFGEQWGWSASVIEHMKTELAMTITSYTSYVDRIYGQGLEETRKHAPSDKAKTEPFNTVNRFIREMTQTVLDFRNLWLYFDISRFPTPPDVYLDREIYSDAVGTSYDSPFGLPRPPREPIKRVVVWGWDRIDAVAVDYPEGGGPDGVTSTGRMGNAGGGSNEPPHGGRFELSQRQPITLVRARTGDILNAMWFQFKNGEWSNMLGGNYSGGRDHDFSYTGHILSSIKIMGKSWYYGCADCAVFGFKLERTPEPSAEAVFRWFRTGLVSRSPAEIARRLGASEERVRDVVVWAELYGWSDLREQYFQDLAARVRRRSGEPGPTRRG